jgi:histidinol-phosphate aminotransferase
MRQRGILVRDRSADPGCEGCVRITIGNGVQTARLSAALREIACELELGREATA